MLTLQKIWNSFDRVSVSLTFQSGKSHRDSATPKLAYILKWITPW
jgi:hypothetical protein